MPKKIEKLKRDAFNEICSTYHFSKEELIASLQSLNPLLVSLQLIYADTFSNKIINGQTLMEAEDYREIKEGCHETRLCEKCFCQNDSSQKNCRNIFFTLIAKSNNKLSKSSICVDYDLFASPAIFKAEWQNINAWVVVQFPIEDLSIWMVACRKIFFAWNLNIKI